MLQPFLEGWTLRQIIQADRLFLVDLKILEDLPTVNDNRVKLLMYDCLDSHMTPSLIDTT